MRKSIFITTALTAVLCLSGCSNVSQEEYDELLEQNVQLQSNIGTLSAEKSALEETVASLERENAQLTADNETLENRNAYLKQQLADNTDSQSAQGSPVAESGGIDQAPNKLPPVVDECLQTGGQYEVFVTETGSEWFVCLDLAGGLAATYLNTDNTTENIDNAYSDILSVFKEYSSACMVMLHWYNSDNECVGMTALINFIPFGLSTIYISDNRIAWSGECSDYNENAADTAWIKSWEENFPCPTDTE